MKRGVPIRSLVPLLLVAGAVGYAGGRDHWIGRVRDAFRPQPEPVPQAVATLPAPPFETRTIDDLHTFVDSLIVDAVEDADLWRPLATETDPDQRERIRDRLHAQYARMLELPERRPARIVQRTRWFARDGVTADLLRLETGPGMHLDAALFMPDAPRTPQSAILAIHGAEGDLPAMAEDLDYHHGFGFELAREGHVVLAPHMVASDVAAHGRTLFVKGAVVGTHILALELPQLMGAIDVLAETPGVDAARIGVYGISRGARHAMLLGALDPRVSAVVASGYFANRFEWLFQPDTTQSDTSTDLRRDIAPGQAMAYPPEMHLLLDDMNLVGLIQPRHLAIVIGREDSHLPSATAEFERVREVYAAAGTPERAVFLTVEGGHETSAADVLPFLARWVADSPTPAREQMP
jgi:hypothetical protein